MAVAGRFMMTCEKGCLELSASMSAANVRINSRASMLKGAMLACMRFSLMLSSSACMQTVTQTRTDAVVIAIIPHRRAD